MGFKFCNIQKFRVGIIFLIFTISLSACDLSSMTSYFTSIDHYSGDPIPQAEVVFQVEIPDSANLTPSVNQNIQIGLEILDEVTGLALNPTRFNMESIDPTHYYVRISAGINTVLRYRYIRISDPPAIEYNAVGQQVRYRMVSISGPAVVQDIVAAWNDQPYQAGRGRISGRIIDSSNTPIPGILVLSGGLQTFSASDGSFLLEGLPPGNQNMVAYATDGSYLPFQQGAIISADATTPAIFEMQPSGLVEVTFIVSVPQIDGGAQIHLVGNTIQFGNSFSDLQGGFSVINNRAPVMTLLDDGRYSVTIQLPEGMYLQYKYSLGDGFWNAEHYFDGRFRIREIIIPNHDVIINDTVETWSMPGSQPVTIEVSVPDDTSINDTISIQFNPYGWTVPIPMWVDGPNQYYYVLYSPMEILGNVSYRFCRNEQCGIADDIVSIDETSPYFFTPSTLSQVYSHSVTEWAGSQEETSLVGTISLNSNPASFVAGIGIESHFSPTWIPHLDQGFSTIRELGANCVVIRPSWTYSQINPPVLEPVAGINPSWFELHEMANLAQNSGLSVILYPEQIYPYSAEAWWQNAARGEDWYSRWFDRFYAQMITSADEATNIGAAALILGGPGLEATLPDGILPNGTSANVPDFIENRWLQLLQEVRAHYNGAIIWALSSPYEIENPPSWIADMDAILVELEINPPQGSLDSIDDLAIQLSNFFSGEVSQIQTLTNRAVLVGIWAPSPSLQQQVDVYQAAFQSIQSFPWITGFISQGFNPAVAVSDTSTSIHGKPASSVISQWFHLYNPN